MILRDVMFKGKYRYQDFLEAGEGISTNILASRLQNLEEDGLLEKLKDPDSGRQFIYIPTLKSLDLIPVMLEMVRWSAKHDPKTAAPDEFLEQLNRNPEQLINQFKKDGLKKISAAKGSRKS